MCQHYSVDSEAPMTLNIPELRVYLYILYSCGLVLVWTHSDHLVWLWLQKWCGTFVPAWPPYSEKVWMRNNPLFPALYHTQTHKHAHTHFPCFEWVDIRHSTLLILVQEWNPLSIECSGWLYFTKHCDGLKAYFPKAMLFTVSSVNVSTDGGNYVPRYAHTGRTSSCEIVSLSTSYHRDTHMQAYAGRDLHSSLFILVIIQSCERLSMILYHKKISQRERKIQQMIWAYNNGQLNAWIKKKKEPRLSHWKEETDI